MINRIAARKYTDTLLLTYRGSKSMEHCAMLTVVCTKQMRDNINRWNVCIIKCQTVNALHPFSVKFKTAV